MNKWLLFLSHDIKMIDICGFEVSVLLWCGSAIISGVFSSFRATGVPGYLERHSQ